MQVIEEVFSSMKQNITRTVLAGFGVAWGIFILILLLGTGRGIQEGINSVFYEFAQKTLILQTGSISKPKMGNSEGNILLFNKQFTENLLYIFSNSIEAVSPEVTFKGNSYITNGKHGGTFFIKGVAHNYFQIRRVKTQQGRLFNGIDDAETRNTIIIGKQVAERLFPDRVPIGKYLEISDTFFKIIGVLESGSVMGQMDENTIYMPYSTLVRYFNQGVDFTKLDILLKPASNTFEVESQLREYISQKFNFFKDDNSALYITNFDKQVKTFNKLFSSIDKFLWFIGLCLLLSGMVSIGNMMLVIVKERTFEIGIRKALGAPPQSILIMVLIESVIITLLSGIAGMIVSVICLIGINYILGLFNQDLLVSHIIINWSVAFFALVFIMIAGVLSGLYPAKKSVDIMPIEAMRNE